jgi:hypothetical protein
MDLTGHTIDARPPRTIGAGVLGVIAAAMLAVAVGTSNVHWAMGAVAPLVLALVFWFRRPRRVQMLVDARGLFLLHGGGFIPYESVSEITVNGGAWSPQAAPSLRSALVVHHHNDERLTIPSMMNVSAAEFHEHLKAKMPAPPERPCPPALADYVAEKSAKFGREKVEVVHARRRFYTSAQWRNLRAVLLGIILTSAAWFVFAALGQAWLGRRDDLEMWMVAAFVGLIAAFPFWILASLRATASSKTRKAASGACVVLTPAGMAMVQGDLQGALRWDEITKVAHVPGGSVLGLLVRGGKLDVLDVYDRSLDEIAMRIRSSLD